MNPYEVVYTICSHADGSFEAFSNDGFFMGTVEIHAEEGDASQLRKVLLVPTDGSGKARSANGDFNLTEEDAKAVLKEFEGHGVDLPVDYEHTSIDKADGPRPAAGWIKKLEYVAGEGLYGFVEWTKRALDFIRAKEYRYLSPAVAIDKGKHVKRFVSAGLVQTPAMVGMPALAAKRQEKTMDTKHLDLIVNQDEGAVASADQLVGELKAALEAKGSEVGNGLEGILQAALNYVKGEKEGDSEGGEGGEEAAAARKALGLDEKADGDAIVTAINSLKGHTGYVPAEEHKKLAERLHVLETAETTRRTDTLVHKAINGGKLLETSEEQVAFVRELAEESAEQFEKWFASAPVIVPQGRTAEPKTIKTNRQTVINKAKQAWNDGDDLADLDIYINGSLRDEGMTPLTDDERKALIG